MNKFFAFSVLASSFVSTAEAKGSLFRHYFKCLSSRRTAQRKTLRTDSPDSPAIDEMRWGPGKQQSPLYDLAASNPHVIAASLFSKGADRC